MKTFVCHDFVGTLTVITPTSLTAGESFSCLLWTNSFPRSISPCDCWRLCFPNSKLNGVTGRLSSTASLKKGESFKLNFSVTNLSSVSFWNTKIQNQPRWQNSTLKFNSTEPYGSSYSFSVGHSEGVLHRGNKTLQDLDLDSWTPDFSWLMYQLTSKYGSWCICQKN